MYHWLILNSQAAGICYSVYFVLHECLYMTFLLVGKVGYIVVVGWSNEFVMWWYWDLRFGSNVNHIAHHSLDENNWIIRIHSIFFPCRTRFEMYYYCIVNLVCSLYKATFVHTAFSSNFMVCFNGYHSKGLYFRCVQILSSVKVSQAYY